MSTTQSLDMQTTGFKTGTERRPLADAVRLATQITALMLPLGITREEIYFCGSIRRKKTTVGDLDILINSTKVNKGFYLSYLNRIRESYDLPPVTDEDCRINKDGVFCRTIGDSQMSLHCKDFLVEFKRTTPDCLGAALIFMTGSGDFNIGMRGYAKGLGFSLSQYGLKDESGKLLAAETEQEIFKALEVTWVEPESRVQFQRPANSWQRVNARRKEQALSLKNLPASQSTQ